jgi:hypothetical protein
VHSTNGDLDATWRRDPGAHSGIAAERIDVTRSTAGARASILIRQDLGDCAIGVRNTDAFTVRAWYRSDVPVRVVLWSRSAAGTWRYWTESQPFAAATDWQELTWPTLAVPHDAVGVSLGLAIDGTGYVVVDDVSAVLTPVVAESSSSFTRRDVRVVLVVTVLLGLVGTAISFGHRVRRPKQIESRG